MTKRFTGTERDAFDKKVYNYIKSSGTVNVNQVARHFQMKWETIERVFKRLQSDGKIFFHPDIRLWSIWPKHGFSKYDPKPEEEPKNSDEGSPTTSTFVEGGPSWTIVRGEPGVSQKKEGFVCHPKTKGKEVSREFIRAHLDGQCVVEVIAVGRMPESFITPSRVTGGWYARTMNGNECYYGHLNTPYDDKTWKFHAMSNKDGNLTKLSVYVHPRYIYYRRNEESASMEFRQQVKDVLNVLEGYGWRFGAITPKGIYHAAINDPILASHMPAGHMESSTDTIHYDSSIKDGKGVSTEAEVYYDHPDADEETALMVELPQRFLNLQAKVDAIDTRMANVESDIESLTDVMDSHLDHTRRLVTSMSSIKELTEFNTSILLGQSVLGDPVGVEAPNTDKEDVMYG